ncbi:MAG: type II toxin-antitoxin system HicA family toxin [Acidobacteria bacterium]|nr:type II toxin-antitoxin system HicA family toxin [Acidobacteriota bacterium]
MSKGVHVELRHRVDVRDRTVGHYCVAYEAGVRVPGYDKLRRASAHGSVKVRDVTKRIKANGWCYVKSRGDHHQFKHPTRSGKVTVKGRPGDEISGALLASIWRQAGLRKSED